MILDILTKLGENPPRSMDDSTLKDDINAMNKVLRERSDDSILNMPQTNNKKIVILHRLYSDLVDVLHFTKPGLVSSVYHRMMEISLKNGITPTTPISFSCYGEMLASSMRMIEEGCRLGRHIFFNPSFNTTLFSPVQLRNALLPISITVEGIVILCKDSQ